ncbi:peptide-methionine (S)-S-oxide reductase [Poritiphilus flavus]|uniref:peptide-methionine (S)-S-oxide reductase n=1 Tax=Poritiphilus flavus TaxID=2697053 RepID=A0A6L9EAI2_9FLAO|nr:peptide-methionine (S)-S-oxide reductase [Poritiphilus flavus]NAS11568.1 peptide methionine sulfoxide reductase [Poritiphilus flavus]
MALEKIAFGGGCHWCTEAVFQSLRGVHSVEQGFVSPDSTDRSFSEAVIVTYDSEMITLKDLSLIHLFTHESTSKHSMRTKYRSAIYTFNKMDEEFLFQIWDELQAEFQSKLITQILPFKEFRASDEQFQNYYRKDPGKPFCKRYIHPKLELLRRLFSSHLDTRTSVTQ